MTLLDIYYPFDTGAGASATPPRWRAMARYFFGSGVIPTVGNKLAATLAGSVVTIQTGAGWFDGFYGENDSNKTVSVSGNGMVVARMDPNARTIAFYFVPNQTVPTQSLTGLYEIPLLRVTGTTATDIRQYSTSLPSHSVVAETMFHGVIGTSWGSTAWAGWWSGTVVRLRPDSIFDVYYGGSAYGTVAGGSYEYGFQITGPVSSSVGVITHFFLNTASEHHTAYGALGAWGSELITAQVVGNVTWTMFIRNNATTAPVWHIDGNDYQTLRIVERMP